MTFCASTFGLARLSVKVSRVRKCVNVGMVWTQLANSSRNLSSRAARSIRPCPIAASMSFLTRAFVSRQHRSD